MRHILFILPSSLQISLGYLNRETPCNIRNAHYLVHIFYFLFFESSRFLLSLRVRDCELHDHFLEVVWP
jgi:hypothetical protein